MTTHATPAQTRAPDALSEAHPRGALQPPVGPLDHAQGPADAAVTLVEYGDYQCPYCGQAFPVIKALQERLGRGLRFVFRNFPLTEIHPRAFHAALAAESVAARAGEEAFWEMHDAIFAHQQDSAAALDDAHLFRYAVGVGANGDGVRQDIAARTIEPRVRADFLSGVRSGVNGTPTFFVNGERYDGDWTDVDAFTAELRRAASARRA